VNCSRRGGLPQQEVGDAHARRWSGCQVGVRQVEGGQAGGEGLLVQRLGIDPVLEQRPAGREDLLAPSVAERQREHHALVAARVGHERVERLAHEVGQAVEVAQRVEADAVVHDLERSERGTRAAGPSARDLLDGRFQFSMEKA
jgi:hypothetical protein